MRLLKNKETLLIALFIASVGVLTSIDILQDLSDGARFDHLILDMAITISAFLILWPVSRKIYFERKMNQMLMQEKVHFEELAKKYQTNSKIFLHGLHSYIDEQFLKWDLSFAEREIALFLLKGMSPKEIAELRNSSEKTVRHQVSAIYKKGNFTSLQEFLSFFLEDLLPAKSQAWSQTTR
jgi:DNA-binding CsgD family transcriptional regulator